MDKRLFGVVVAGATLLFGNVLRAQDVGWLRPYLVTPYYWELVEAKGGFPTMPLFAGPRLRAVAVVRDSVGTGDRIAMVAEVSLLIGADTQPKGAIIGDVTELRFLGADSAGVSLQLRKKDTQTPVFSTCTQSRFETFFHVPDWRYQVLASCTDLITWSEWQPLRFPLKGTYVVPIGRSGLSLTFAMAGDTLTVKVNQ